MTYLNFETKTSTCLFIAGALALLAPSSAHAIRIANFSGAAQNVTRTDKVREAVESSCIITVTNVSNVQQSVKFNIRLYAVSASGGGCTVNGTRGQSCSGAGADNLYATITNASLGLADPLILASSSASVTESNCTASSNTCTLPMSGTAMNYPAITAGQIASQNVRCEGYISVENTTSGSPGYVIASGSLVTFVESIGGVALGYDPSGNANGTGKNNTTAPTFTSITIGEGRPF